MYTRVIIEVIIMNVAVNMPPRNAARLMFQMEMVLPVRQLTKVNGMDATVLPRVVVISPHEEDATI
jgi:hypothetical protein